MVENTHLPENLAQSVRLVHEFATDIVTAGSGFEQRNARYAASRRHYVLDTGPRPLSEIHALVTFFAARRGRHQGFLLHDFMDCHSGFGDTPTATDQELEDPHIFPTRTEFALVKRYAPDGPVRRILKPRREGFMLARDGKLLDEGVDYKLNVETGSVEILNVNLVTQGLTAGFYFSVPVRFDADRIEVTRLDGDMGQITPLPLIEVKLPERLEEKATNGSPA